MPPKATKGILDCWSCPSLWGGGIQAWEKARQGGFSPPMPPPIYTYRGSFWLVLLVDLLIIWNRVACKLITLFLIFLHCAIRTCTCFFFGVPPFEELQDPGSSPRREEVGRRTLGEYGGFPLPFFYRARFRESTSTTRKRQARKMYPNKTPITSGVEESNSPRRVLLLLLSNSSGGHHLKKKHICEQAVNREYNSTMTRLSPKKVYINR